MMQDSIIKLALDVGNKRIKFVVGELSSDGNKLRIVDYLDLESEGIRKSVIEDAERLTYLISKGINSIAKRTGIKFKKVSLGVSSARLVSKTGHALIDFEDEKEITCEDVENLVSKSDDYTIFELSDALSKKQPERAIKIPPITPSIKVLEKV